MPTLMIYSLAVIPMAWIAVTDIRKRKIPLVPLAVLVALGAAKAVFIEWSYLVSSVAGFLLIGIPMLWMACRLDHGNGIGGGDVKLCAVLGFLLGPGNALIVLVAALFLLVVFTLLICRRRDGQPFAPFALLCYAAGLILMLIGG